MPRLKRPGASAVRRRLGDFQQQGRVQAGSLIISVFGDAVLPHGGRIWLGSLIRLLAPLGISERLVRTAVYRLGKEGWLSAEPAGRRTDYRLTPAGVRRFEDASRHIYSAAVPHWDGRWRLIVAAGEFAPRERESLRRALFWQGFGTLGSDCFVHPSADLSTAFEALIDEGQAALLPRLKPLLAAQIPAGEAASDLALVRAAWNLDTLAETYDAFVGRYQPVLDQVRADTAAADDESAFALRTLLIHDYRRALLRDPELPAVLLPPNWPGLRARLLSKELYRRLLPGSQRFFEAQFQLAVGTAPAAQAVLGERFRDIDPLADVPAPARG